MCSYYIIILCNLCNNHGLVHTERYFRKHLDREERAVGFALFVFLVSPDCCVALPHDAKGLSAVCICGIS